MPPRNQYDVDISADPARFEEAIADFRNRIPMTDEEFESILEEERQYAFHVAGATQADVVTQVYEALQRAIEQGTDFDDFRDDVGAQLEQSWGQPIGGRLETIFRTNVMTAYNRGRYRIMTRDVVKEARPYWRAEVVDDDRTSDICEELIDVILPADDPFWSSHIPPLHHNCRTHLTPLSEEEAHEEGVDTDPPDMQADDGFGDAPDDEDYDFEPDFSSYPSAIADELERKVGG